MWRSILKYYATFLLVRKSILFKRKPIMKKLLLTLIVMLAFSGIMRAQNSLIVTFADGSHQSFLLSTLPDIRMANDKMTITTSTTTAEYDLYTVKTFTFGNATAINAVNTGKLSVSGDALIVPNANASVNAFALDGTEVNVSVSHAGNGSTVVDLSSLPSGKVYIIRAAGKVVKIIR